MCLSFIRLGERQLRPFRTTVGRFALISVCTVALVFVFKGYAGIQALQRLLRAREAAHSGAKRTMVFLADKPMELFLKGAGVSTGARPFQVSSSAVSSTSSTSRHKADRPTTHPVISQGQVEPTTPAAQPRSPHIRPASFVYLVLGKGSPAQKWIAMSKWQNVTVIFMSWRDSINNYVDDNANNLRITYFPNSTWTTCRNRLAELASQLEEKQGWKFEYFVFFDEDVLLKRLDDMSCMGGSVNAGECEERSFRALNHLLERDRPMQAAFSYGEENLPRNTGAVQRCLLRCHRDHLMLAIHRTATSFLLPYNTRLDNVNWWSSAYIENMLMSGIIPDFCSYYRDVIVDTHGNEHRYYPHRTKVSSFEEFNPARIYSARALANAGLAGWRANMAPWEALGHVMAQLNPQSATTKSCLTFKEGVDFRSVIGDKLNLLVKLHQ